MYTEDLVVQRACEKSGCVPNYTTTSSLLILQQPGPRLLSFDTFILEVSLEFQTILWYRWTFQSERQLVMSRQLVVSDMQFVSTKVQVFPN